MSGVKSWKRPVTRTVTLLPEATGDEHGGGEHVTETSLVVIEAPPLDSSLIRHQILFEEPSAGHGLAALKSVGVFAA
jgi:hypothetical protein